ncbi:MAG: hypothetical protein H0W24_09270 [Lysobacter sp.]|nr:hypothetical protein [Lysobacter sp.]MDQ3270436.1 hypothetical protein [Pseudomonadota bacterium]
MPARTRQRLRICLVVMLCLFFQQVAVAAYACTMPRMPADATLLGDVCAEMEGMAAAPAQEAPALCVKHCAPDPSLVSDHAAPGVPMLALPPVARDLLQSRSTWQASSVAIVRSDPPPRLRYCSLLI